MIQSPNCFALPCAGPFHKINAGYVATTTTVNSTCLMYGYYYDADKCAALRMYACVHMRVAAYTAFIRELRKICGTSVKIIQLNEYGCRDAPCEKSWKQGNPLSNTIKDTSTIMRNPPYIVQTKGYA